MQATSHTRLSRRYVVVAVLGLLALYVILPQLTSFHTSLHLLRHPQSSWLIAGTLLTGLTYFAGAATYCLLAFRPLRYGQVLLVQIAAMFINRLLPAGIGAIGVNYTYLTRHKHSASQAAAVVSVNNLLGAIGHGLLLMLIAVFGAHQLNLTTINQTHSTGLWVRYSLVASLILLTVLILGRHRLRLFLRDLGRQLWHYRQRPVWLGAALLSSMILTLANVLALYACAQALGTPLSFAAIFVIFSLGISAGTATPIPGGLGGFEAGLVAGFLAYHVDASVGLAVALLYRLISYWLPLAVGGIVFLAAERHKLI